jgi:hypothetical protein
MLVVLYVCCSSSIARAVDWTGFCWVGLGRCTKAVALNEVGLAEFLKRAILVWLLDQERCA